MAYWIPADRVHLLMDSSAADASAAAGTAATATNATNPAALAGGASESKGKKSKGKGTGKGKEDKRVFQVVTAEGMPVVDEHGVPRTFAATQPIAAAAKAFRTFVRSAAGERALEALRTKSSPRRREGKEGKEGKAVPPSVRQIVAAAVRAGTLTAEEGATYLANYWDGDAALYELSVDIYLGSADRAAVRRYVVRYVPLLKPNAHELTNGINKVAEAKYVAVAKVVPPAYARFSPPRAFGAVSHRAASTERKEEKAPRYHSLFAAAADGRKRRKIA